MEINQVEVPLCQVGRRAGVGCRRAGALLHRHRRPERCFRWDPASGDPASWDVPDMVGSMALRGRGPGAIVALVDGIHTLDFETGAVNPSRCSIPRTPTSSSPTARSTGPGRFVFGTSHRKAGAGWGAFRARRQTARLTQLDDDLILGNGPCWSPDNKTLYHADSHASHRSMPTITTSRAGAAANRRRILRIRALTARSLTERRSMPTAISGSRSAKAAWCCASRPRARSSGESNCRRASRRAACSAGPTSTGSIVPTIDPPSLGRDPARWTARLFVIEGIGANGLPNRASQDKTS